MKSYKVFLSHSQTFPFISLCKEKIIITNANDLQGHPEDNNLNTSKNSTFTLGPNALSIAGKKGQQVLLPVRFEVHFDDGAPRISGLMPGPKTIVLN